MKKITIYSTPTCHFCHLVKDFFRENNIEYEEIDVAADQTKAEEMVAKSGQMGVPVIIVRDDSGGEKILVGFQEGKLKEVLGI